MLSPEPRAVPVFILCGGMGSRLGEMGATRPKPMLEIGDRPLLLHIMSWYARFGFRRFVLCTGHRSEVISSYFLNFAAHHADCTIETGRNEISYHQRESLPDWEVTVAFTGRRAMTGARLARAAARYLGDAEHFAVTYGDGLTDADLADEFGFHLGHARLGTVLGVEPPSPFGQLVPRADGSIRLIEKPCRGGGLVSGGFFFFRRPFLAHLSTAETCVLEREPLTRLSEAGELLVYPHDGFWSCVDTLRDREEVQALWESGAAPWKC